VDEILTTFNGEDNTHSYSAVHYTPADSASASASASASSTTTPNPKPKKHKSPIGAIVGGVVGGLAIMGIALFSVVFLCMRKRSAARNTPYEPEPTNMAPAPYASVPLQNAMAPQKQYPDNRTSYYPSPQEQFNQQQYNQQSYEAKVPIETISPVSVAQAPPYYQSSVPPQSPPPMHASPVLQAPRQGAVEMGDGFAMPKQNNAGQQIHEAQG
jgi:hypothetical protein